MDKTKYTNSNSRHALVAITNWYSYSGECGLQEGALRRIITFRAQSKEVGIEQTAPISTSNRNSLNHQEKSLKQVEWKYLWVNPALYHRDFTIPGLHLPGGMVGTLGVEDEARDHDLHELDQGKDQASPWWNRSLKAVVAFKLEKFPVWIFPAVSEPTLTRTSPCGSTSGWSHG